MPIFVGQQFFNGIGMMSDREEAAADFGWVAGRAGVGIVHHKVRGAVDIFDSNGTVSERGI